jgi:hypothetical protein
LAAIPLLVGTGIVVAGYSKESYDGRIYHEKVACAHDYLARERLLLSDDEMKEVKPWQVPWQLYEELQVGQVIGPYTKDWLIRLNQIGCSDLKYDVVSYGEARNPPTVSSVSEETARFAKSLLAITLTASLVVYGIVRAIGWVIGGFAAS